MTEFEQLATIEPKASQTEEFRKLAEYLLRNWIISAIDSKFEIFEVEFLLQTKSDIHPDPNIDASPLQFTFGNWYVPNGGIDITFGCEEYAASIYIRSLRDIESGKMIVGPQRCFDALFQNAGSVINPKPVARLLKVDPLSEFELWNVPRANLSFGEHSKNLPNQLKFIFKPYRFIRSDIQDFPEKYTALLYSEKIKNESLKLKQESGIYQKYLKAFSQGRNLNEIEQIWRISSRNMRLAALLGYMKENQPQDLV
jgi:hypothetical protein